MFKKSKMKEYTTEYKVNEGDILRFGRVITRVREIKFNKNKNEILNKNENDDLDFKMNQKIKIHKISKKRTEPNLHMLTISKNKNNNINYIKDKIIYNNLKINDLCNTNKKEKNDIPKVCRICYCEEEPLESLENPLVQPCKCSGSLKYIHLNCLKHWLNTKSLFRIESNENFTFFLIKPVECELCKAKFPDIIKHRGKLYEILEYKSEFEYYCIIESLTVDKNRNRFVYVVSLNNNKKLKIGRGSESDLILGDISVSRIHSLLIIENKNIYLRDNNSKFGTLVLFQSPSIKVIDNLPLFIQVGRTFFDCRIKTNSNCFLCCNASETPNLNYYHIQNEKYLNIRKNLTIESEKEDSEYDGEKEEKNNNLNKLENQDIKEKQTEDKKSEKDNLYGKLRLSLNDNEGKNEEDELNLTTYKKYKFCIKSNNTSDLKMSKNLIDDKEDSISKNESIHLEKDNISIELNKGINIISTNIQNH